MYVLQMNQLGESMDNLANNLQLQSLYIGQIPLQNLTKIYEQF